MADEPVTLPPARPVCECPHPSTVKLDPTTKAGATCHRCGYSRSGPYRAEVEIIEVPPFSPSE